MAPEANLLRMTKVAPTSGSGEESGSERAAVFMPYARRAQATPPANMPREAAVAAEGGFGRPWGARGAEVEGRKEAGASLPSSPFAAAPPAPRLGLPSPSSSAGGGRAGPPRLLSARDGPALDEALWQRCRMFIDLAAQREEEEEEDPEVAFARHEAFMELGCRCPDINGYACWFCDDDDDDDDDEDDDCIYEDWEGCSEEPEEERAQSASPATFCGFKKSFLCKSPPASAPPVSSSQDCPLLGIALPQKQQLTAEEAEKNAEELVAEEERIKKKAEKKRMKKRRQKDRKRQEKRDQQVQAKKKAEADQTPCGRDVQGEELLAAIPGALEPSLPDSGERATQDPRESPASPDRSPSRSTEEETEEELDLTSTFVSKARLKVSTKSLPLRKEKPARPARLASEVKVQQEVPQPELQMTPVEQSLVLADHGNEIAKQGCYQEAVLLFTEAVKLNPREYRLFGNRSFCYEKLQCYTAALQDAQLALSLQPGWPKGLFRQGKALMGLKRYTEAARTFEELLRLDGFRSDAAIQLERCRIQLLLENGFSQWNTLARDARLPLPGGRPLASSSSGSQAGGPRASVTITNSKCKTLPPPAAQAPVREWFAVWVGNLTPQVTQEVLLHYFQPFGPIHSVRRLPRKFCAFVNYTRKEAAEAAFRTLQGFEVGGSKLLLQLKHPVHATPPHTKTPSSAQQPVKR